MEQNIHMNKSVPIKINEIDWARGIAIVAVMMIHVTAAPVTIIAHGSRSQIIYEMIDRLSSFAVPVFVMLSGVVLFYRYGQRWHAGEIVEFYKKRIKFIILPYVLWSLFYDAAWQFASSGSLRHVHIGASDFMFKLLWGSASYHLYFIVIIVQFYLLFPLLMSAVNRFPRVQSMLLPTGIAVAFLFYYINHSIHPFSHAAAICFDYFIPYCFGAYTGLNYRKFERAKHHLWWVFAATVFIGFSYFLFFILERLHIDFGLPVYYLLYNSYAVGMGLSLLWAGQTLSALIPKTNAWIRSAGVLSLGIYFIHPLLLEIWVKLFHPKGSAIYHLSVMGSLIWTAAFSWVLVRFLKKWRWSWIFVGK